MLRPREALVGALLVSCSSGLEAPAAAHPGQDAATIRASRRPLQGRFLHITDFHPDPFFKTYSSTEENAACHRKHGPAGFYGAETSACDSPISLVNATMDWIRHNIADDVDFVIWTGDSARHDNDEKIPRTGEQIIAQNEFMVAKLAEVFGHPRGGNNPTKAFRIPVVPTFGNNDIMPHNILLAGPNKWTLKYMDMWRSFVPEAQRHQFLQGGWFSVEVIPGKLAVVSLNTLYFFSSNSGVDGCAKKREPGYEQFEWLRVQLQIIRDRGMSAILIGHVPPAHVSSKNSWDETCWQKYALWERQYRDVIVGSLFGHMNLDHFMLQDFHHIKKSAKKGLMAASNIKAKSHNQEDALLMDGEVTVASASDYLRDLRRWWSKLPSPPKKKKKHQSIAEYIAEEEFEGDYPSFWQKTLSVLNLKKNPTVVGKKKTFLDKIGGPYAERYSVSLVSPSVVPNYFPTIRVIEYNITGLEHLAVSPVSPVSTHAETLSNPLTADVSFLDDATYLQHVESILKHKYKNKEKESPKKRKKYKFKVPKPPSKGAPPGPAYSPQPLTFTSYTQYFANLTRINNDFVDQTSYEDSPHAVFGLEVDEDGKVESKGWKEGKHGKHQGKKPRPKPHPKKFTFEVEYDTKTDERYKLKDLTVRSWLDLARRIGEEDGESAAYGEEDGYEDKDGVHGEASGGGGGVGDGLGKHKGKKGKKKHKKSKNKTWLTFVDRAFVRTLGPGELQSFGRGGLVADEDMNKLEGVDEFEDGDAFGDVDEGEMEDEVTEL